MLLAADLKLRTRFAYRRFRGLLRDPARAQANTLRRILEQSSRTAFGRDHRFASLATVQDFQAAVPIRSYDQYEPYIRRVADGEDGVLTSDPITMFATTSGTTGEPKLIPVTETSRKSIARLVRLWMYRCVADHPDCFNGTTLAVSSPAVEGFTAGRIPCGSMSGLTYQRLPALIRGQFAVPYAVALVKDPDVRYLLTMRFALASRVSSIATPNATTLLRLADVARTRTDDILRAIHDGNLGVAIPEFIDVADAEEALRSLKAACPPQPARARALSAGAASAGYIRLRDAWPGLSLIGCWLGGTAGRNATRLAEVFGDVPKRDLGLIATEGRMTIPLEDESPFGPLAVGDVFFEFVPDGDEAASRDRPLLAHELETGGRYRVLLTGLNGLYRYDINDIVEAGARFEGSVLVAFARKGRDVANITGEKLHVNQVSTAIGAVEAALGLHVVQFRLIPDVDALRYDLLVESDLSTRGSAAFAEAFDDALIRLNVEYASKRKSSRLLAPRLFVMRSGWSERQARADFAAGRREHQYKFACMRDEWDDQSRDEVVPHV